MEANFTGYHPIRVIKQNLNLERAWLACMSCGEELQPEGLRILYVQKTDPEGQRYGRVQVFMAPHGPSTLEFKEGEIA